MEHLSKLDVPLQLETAGGDLTLDTIGDLFCGGIVCHGVVFNPLLTVTLFSTSRGEKDGYFYERCLEGYGVLKGPTGNVKLERSGGLDTTLTPNTCAEDIWNSIREARRARP